MKNTLVCLLMLSVQLSFGQLQIDSLTQVIPTIDGEVRVTALQQLGSQMVYVNLSAADSIIQESVKAADELGFVEGQVRGLTILGAIIGRQGDFDKAEQLLNQGIAIAESNNRDKLLAACYVNLGAHYFLNGYYELAARTHKKGLEITMQDSTLVEYEIPHLMNLGLVNKELGNYPEAREYLNEALVKSSPIGIVFRDAQIYGNLGSVEIEDANYGKAIEHFMDALSIFEEASAGLYVAKTHINLANCYLNLGELSKAENSLEIAFHVVSEAQEQQDIAEYYQILGELDFQRKNYSEAENALLKSIEVSKSINDYARTQTVLYILVELYKATEQIEKRSASLEELIALNATIYEKDQKFSIIQLNREFDLDKLTYEKEKEAEIAQLTLEKRNVLILLLVAGVLVLIVALLWYRQVSKLKILKQQADIDAKEQTFKQEAERFEFERGVLEKSLDEATTLNKSLKEEIDKFQSVEDASRSAAEMEELTTKIKTSLLADKDWIAFNIYFEALYPKFSENLRANFDGKITNYEQRLIRLIKLELTNKEMSMVLAIQRDSVVKAKVRLKDKLRLESIQDLEKFATNI